MTIDSSQKILFFQKPSPLIPFAESLISITPKVSLVEGDIYADIACTEKLFGGETKTLEKVESLLNLFHIHSPWLMTEKINWAQPLCIKDRLHLKKGESYPLLLSLPIEALMVCGNPLTLKKEEKERQELVEFLRKVGIVFCGDFLKTPISSIARRFGKIGSHLFSVMKDNTDSVLPWFQPTDPISFTIETDSFFSLDSLFYELKQVLPKLEARLEGRNALVHELKLAFYLENKTTQSHLIPFAKPSRDPKTILNLLQEFLSQKSWAAPLHRFTIEVVPQIQQSLSQLNLLDDSEERFEDLSLFVKQMRERLGENRVGFSEIRSSFLPEQSWDLIASPKSDQTLYPDHSRPFFLFSTPFPFQPSAKWKLTELERLTIHWWKQGIVRHYFLAESLHGERLWVFWEPFSNNWFCHGSFD